MAVIIALDLLAVGPEPTRSDAALGLFRNGVDTLVNQRKMDPLS
ncbi:hypothetical protein [Parasphingorhabdus marina]|nr:hypothetical protein [Parasphingorhabdus marina]